jgi:hypothetical protein
MNNIYVIIYLAILIIFWRWWAVAILAVMFMRDFFPTENLWLLAVLAMHAIGLFAELVRRRKRKKARADSNARQETEIPSRHQQRKGIMQSLPGTVGVMALGAAVGGMLAAAIGTFPVSLPGFKLAHFTSAGWIIVASVAGAAVAYGTAHIIRRISANIHPDRATEDLKHLPPPVSTIEMENTDRTAEELKHLPPETPAWEWIIDINTASREELLILPGIGVAEADLILKRTQSGQKFGRLNELVNYLHLKPHKLIQLRGKVRFSAKN